MKKISLLSLALLLGCSTNNYEANSIDQNMNQNVLDYDVIETSIHWANVFIQNDDRYLVYFYSEHCGFCRTIKEEFLSYYLECNESIYFVNAIEEKAIYKGGADSLLGKNSIVDFYIPGTPFLIELTNHSITNYYLGVDNIRMYINSSEK